MKHQQSVKPSVEKSASGDVALRNAPGGAILEVSREDPRHLKTNRGGAGGVRAGCFELSGSKHPPGIQAYSRSQNASVISKIGFPGPVQGYAPY